jgi:hypothetical protein
MVLPEKLTKYFEENKDKPRDEVIKELMKKFGYKESTAISRYSDRKHDSISLKKIAFDFFKENPSVLEETDNKKYYKKLGMSIASYATYKSQYKSENQKLIKSTREKEIKEQPKYGEKYYKGKLREKFTFDDSKLFG